mmetsp:Transcript_17492/g.56620  ORF Transcript_17492/g.56620 Transcript_17492/m.56620 type:complete len:221 (+) Transcript_17492:2278-2940(+)
MPTLACSDYGCAECCGGSCRHTCVTRRPAYTAACRSSAMAPTSTPSGPPPPLLWPAAARVPSWASVPALASALASTPARATAAATAKATAAATATVTATPTVAAAAAAGVASAAEVVVARLTLCPGSSRGGPAVKVAVVAAAAVAAMFGGGRQSEMCQTPQSRQSTPQGALPVGSLLALYIPKQLWRPLRVVAAPLGQACLLRAPVKRQTWVPHNKLVER